MKHGFNHRLLNFFYALFFIFCPTAQPLLRMVQDLSKLAQLNLRSLQGIPVQLRLLEDKISGMGSGQFFTTRMSRLMERYQDLADAGDGGAPLALIRSITGKLLNGDALKATNHESSRAISSNTSIHLAQRDSFI